MSATGALLDTPLTAYLDCEHEAMAHSDGEERLVERLKAGDADALEPLLGGLRSLLLDELGRGRP